MTGCGNCKSPYGHFDTCECRCHSPETLTRIAVTARTEGAVVLNELEEANE